MTQITPRHEVTYLDKLDDHLIDQIMSHLNISERINVWRVTRRESLIQQLLSTIQLNSLENMNSNRMRDSIETRETMMQHLKHDLSDLIQREPIQRREERLIRIPFRNFVLLRYWHLIITSTFTLPDLAYQCPCCMDLIETNPRFDDMGGLQHDKCLSRHNHDEDELDLNLFLNTNRYLLYSYGDARQKLEWFSCREYLPICDQKKFEQFYSLKPEEIADRQQKEHANNSIANWHGFQTESDSFEAFKASHWLPTEPNPAYVMVDPEDYPKDRRHWLQEENLDPWLSEIQQLPHYDTPVDYNVGYDLCDLQIIDLTTGKVCWTDVLPRTETTPDRLHQYMNHFHYPEDRYKLSFDVREH